MRGIIDVQVACHAPILLGIGTALAEAGRMSSRRVMSAVLTVVAVWAIGCAPAIRSTAPGPLAPREVAEFWEDVDPRSRDLFHGVAGPRAQPDPEAVYTVKTTDTSGFSKI